MTVPVQETVFNHVGNGVTTIFVFECLVLDEDDLVVYVDDEELTSGYTVSGIGVEAGGTVTITSAPASDVAVRIERVIELKRTTDYQQNGDFLSPTVNADYDRIWMALQRIDYLIGSAPGTAARMLKLGTGDTNGSGSYRALQNRIQDLADPVDMQDATNQQWVLEQIASFSSDGAGQAVLDLLAASTGVSRVGSAAWYATTISGFDASDVPTGATVIFSGRDTANDGGGGVFSYNSTSAQTTDGGTVFAPTGGGRLFRDGWTVFGFNGRLQLRWFGAKGDGTTDDYAAIQAALDLGMPCEAPTGTFRITQGLVLKNGSKLLGLGNYSGIDTLTVYPTAIYEGTTVIWYDGTAGADVAVVRAATEAVGTEPVDVDTRNLVNIGLTNVVLDGGSKAGIGLYAVRAFMNNKLDYITVTNTTAHAFLAMQCFGGTPTNWIAFINEGCGITVGRDVYGWTSYGVDQTAFISCWAFRCGCDADRNYLAVFDDANPDAAYGIGYYTGRSTKFVNVSSTYNGGVGIYCETDRWPGVFDGGYLEFNCYSLEGEVTPVGSSGKRWGVWFEGVSNLSRHIKFRDFYTNGPSGNLDCIRLSGTEPSRSGEDAVIFENWPLLQEVAADWQNYRLIDCDSTVTLSDEQPYMIQPVLNGELNLSVSGMAAFQVAAAAITAGGVYAGIIESVSYVSTGIYDVTFNTTLATSKYMVDASGSDNRIVGVTSKTTTGFRITSRTPSSGAVTDSSFVHIAVLGYFEV